MSSSFRLAQVVPYEPPRLIRERLSCRVLKFPVVAEERGNLGFIEANEHVPFAIKRVFFINGVPVDQSRGGHAHRNLHQVLIAISGHLDVVVDDGECRKTYALASPWSGLYIPPLQWATEINFAPGTVCGVLASDHFDENDHIRDYSEYLLALEP